METKQVLRCSECAAPLRDVEQVRCDYCGFWFKKETPSINEIIEKQTEDIQPAIASKAVEIIIGFILVMVAVLIGVNLLGPMTRAIHP